jgi:hypothetical protein
MDGLTLGQIAIWAVGSESDGRAAAHASGRQRATAQGGELAGTETI